MAITDVDVAIGGGGPVGMALAAMLVRAGMAPARVALIDGRELEQAQRDPRSIAVSYGSRLLLEQIGAWPWSDGARNSAARPSTPSAFASAFSSRPSQPSQLSQSCLDTTPHGVTAIEQIHVSRRGSFGRTLLEAGQFGLPALGYVIHYGELVTALAAAVERAGVRTLRPVQLLGSDEHADSIDLRLSGQSTLSTAILALAEGGVFAGSGASLTTTAGSNGLISPGTQSGHAAQGAQERTGGSNSDGVGPAQASCSRAYDQTAVIAFVKTEMAAANRAHERFTEEGPLALLPQGDGHALVWCVKPERAAALMDLPETLFLARLQEAFGARLGRFLSAGKRSTYPLGLKTDTSLSPRRISIGNAAQTLHPVAGQGLNLGLRDAAVLARLLARDISPVALEHFLSQRRTDRGGMIRLTDLMARIFTTGADGSASQGLLGLSLGLIDGLPPARRLLGDLMMFGYRS